MIEPILAMRMIRWLGMIVFAAAILGWFYQWIKDKIS